MTARRIFLIFAGLACLVALVLSLPSFRKAEPLLDEHVQAMCSSCHFFPGPELLPRSAWRAQIEHMAFVVDTLPGNAEHLDFDVEAYVAKRLIS